MAAIIVTVAVSVVIGTTIVDLRQINKERDNIKTEEDLKEFERKILTRSYSANPRYNPFFPDRLRQLWTIDKQ